ncbi:Uncharacterised protein [Corynebacterium renale]|nr:Uncharacterised protein [Corynebacterium renale]
MCVCVAAGFVVSKLLTGMSWAATTHTWLDYQGSLPTSLTGLLALILALSTLNQRTRSDDRAAYYDRAQWAINLTLEEDPAKRSAGWAFLEAITESGWKYADDKAFVESITRYSLEYREAKESSSMVDDNHEEAP